MISHVPGAIPLQTQINLIGKRARAAARALVETTPAERSACLAAIAAALRAAAPAILSANAEDTAQISAPDAAAEARLDRMRLTPERLEAVAANVDAIAALPDPVGAVMAEWIRPNGLVIQRVRVPMGVVGMIFENRPNVAADASALALRAGNVIVLRGSSESHHSVAAIVQAIRGALASTGLPQDVVQALPSTDRAAVGMMLAGMDGAIDVIIPRGGKSLVARVQEEARVPVLAHLEGVCHTYVHANADPEQAIALTVNAKMRRVSVCGATETLLIDRVIAPSLLPRIAAALCYAGCQLRGDAEARAIVEMAPATEADWRTEYLAPILSVRVVGGIDDAIAHIAAYGTQHTDCIITKNEAAAERFIRQVDSAIVLHNASTQFADGGEFGFGGEIGIATGRLHARGPVGAEQLTTFKYVVRGAGQVRP